MPRPSLLQQSPRASWNELHRAAQDGSVVRTIAILSRGSIGIDERDPQGYTPLMLAASQGQSPVVGILLDKGANASMLAEGGLTALHISAHRGDLAVSLMLMEAGADLEAKDCSFGYTPLSVAATKSRSNVMRALIKAGADPNSRSLDGSTPLHLAVEMGHVDAMKLLLRAEANPLLTRRLAGQTVVPLDMTAQVGHTAVVRGMIQEIGIEGCGGASGGVDALIHAARNQHMDTMTVLIDAGVDDPGQILTVAAGFGHEASVKFLLLQDSRTDAYLNNTRGSLGRMPLVSAITGLSSSTVPSTRIVRLLVDAGADTASIVRIKGIDETVVFNDTPLACTTTFLREKKTARGELATQEQLHRLEGIRRLLLRVEAVHAVSFVWPSGTRSIDRAAGGTAKTGKVSASVTSMLPILRRRAARPRVLLAALFRYSGKP